MKSDIQGQRIVGFYPRACCYLVGKLAATGAVTQVLCQEPAIEALHDRSPHIYQKENDLPGPAAYHLLLQRECPSWLYPVTMGATTIWERWDSMLPDGSINPGEMTSFNHYALGAVADWLHRTVGGIAPAELGYQRIAIQPRPGGGLSYASARHLTPYGMAECTWKIQDGNMDVNVVVPPNATASVYLPGKDGEAVDVESGTHHWSYAYQAPDARQALSVDNTIGEINDDPTAWSAVTNTLTRLVPQNVFIVNMLQSQSRKSLRHGLATLPNADEVITA